MGTEYCATVARCTLIAVIVGAEGLAGCDQLFGIQDHDLAADANVTSDASHPEDAGYPEGASYPEVVLADQPVLYLRLGESQSTLPAKDEVPDAPTGTYGGGVSLGKPGAIVGDPNTAVEVDAGYVRIGNDFPFAGHASFSIEAWVLSYGSPGAYQDLLLKRDQRPSGQYGYNLFLAQDMRVCVERWNGDAGAAGAFDKACSVSPLPVGLGAGYHHVVATYDGTTLSMYVDGALSQTAPSNVSLTTSTSDLQWTLNPNGDGGAGLLGLIDEVAIYDHALSASRVALHARTGLRLP